MAGRQNRNLGFALVMLSVSLLFTSPVVASEPPAVGCNASGCSVYFLSYAWPNVVKANALEFVKFEIRVGKLDAGIHSTVSYLGGLCAIPGSYKIVPFCPAPSEDGSD